MSTNATSTGHVAVRAAREYCGPDADIGEPRKLAGGAMHDSWAVDASTHGATRELVVRVSPAGRADHEKTRREFEVLRVAFARGIACPEPLIVGLCESGDDFLVMTRAKGDANPQQLIGNDAYGPARRHIIERLAQNLADIHKITATDVAAAPRMRSPEPGEDPLRFERRLTEEAYRIQVLNPHPAIEWAFRWIDRAIAALDGPDNAHCVVHGDFRIGNMLYDHEGLTAILDWEGVHIGDADEDLAWFCTRVWRFGRSDLEAGGIASREVWLAAYESASGRTVSRERIAAWEVLQNVRWAQITMMQARAHLDGQTVSHELAAIGRRTAETELEILRLTGVEERVANAR